MKASGNYVQVLACGVVISNTMPCLAASPDRKVIDKECGYGLVEINKVSFHFIVTLSMVNLNLKRTILFLPSTRSAWSHWIEMTLWCFSRKVLLYSE